MSSEDDYEYGMILSNIENDSNNPDNANNANGVGIRSKEMREEKELLLEITNNDNDNDFETLDFNDRDLTPSYLPNYDVGIIEQKTIEKNDPQSNIVVSPSKKTDSLLNDFQYAFYQKMVQNIWCYEKSTDRNRIKLEKNALDEANVSLSDINYLLKKKLIYKVMIPHPKGSFTVYSIKNNIQKEIIKEIIGKLLLKNRFSLEKKRFQIVNWQEIGLIKKEWEFDFSIKNIQLIGIIVLISDFPEKNIKNLSDKLKERLKGLIASNELKLNSFNNPFLISDSGEINTIIDDFITKSGWGKIEFFNFSNKIFDKKFLQYLNKKIQQK